MKWISLVLITAIMIQIISNLLWAHKLSKSTKIRLSMRPRGKTEGMFANMNSDSIVVSSKGERRPISLHSLREIEMVTWRKTNLLKGALLGMAAGGGLGTLAAQNEGYSEESFAYSHDSRPRAHVRVSNRNFSWTGSVVRSLGDGQCAAPSCRCSTPTARWDDVCRLSSLLG